MLSTKTTAQRGPSKISGREKAYKNVLALAINRAIDLGLFGRRQADDPKDSPVYTGGALFEFQHLGHRAVCYAADIGHEEISIHVHVDPTEKYVSAVRAGLCADRRQKLGAGLIAEGWLERKDGFYIQNADSLFSGAKELLQLFADASVEPNGFKMAGRVRH